MVKITKEVVEKLIKEQFPKWADLDIKPVEKSGHDNRTFHLGDEMTVRLPSGEDYVAQVEKEIQWLPKLKPFITLQISSPIAKGKPNSEYPFPWSINKYIEGETATYDKIHDLNKFAVDLGLFLKELHKIDTIDGPIAGKHNFYRGGDLKIYNSETEVALENLKDILPIEELHYIWTQAISSKWENENVWIHGDIAPGNLLVKNGALCGVIDFGIMAVGDPSCDYAMGWTFFDKNSRKTFFNTLECDENTINRARGWALWKALITYFDKNIEVANNARFTIQSIIEELNIK